MAYHWLKSRDNSDLYANYLNGEFTRREFYQKVPEQVIKSVINAEIGYKTLPGVFREIDSLLNNVSWT